MQKRSSALSIGLAAFVAILLIAACSGDKTESQRDRTAADSIYAGWQTFTYGNFRIHHPRHHIRDTLFQEDAKIWDAIRRRQAVFLGVNDPSDTVDIMFFTGDGQGKEMTGREYPFVSNDTIYFWLPSFYGPVMARYLIEKWHPDSTRFPFLREGIIALLDFSGQNYHSLAIRNIDENRFESLADLAVDTAVNSDRERNKTCEAASFVDFVVFRYGRPALRALYGHGGPFGTAVNDLFKVSVDSLQSLWLQTAHQGAALDTADTKQ